MNEHPQPPKLTFPDGKTYVFTKTLVVRPGEAIEHAVQRGIDEGTVYIAEPADISRARR